MTNPELVIANAFQMDDATWKRHAHPWCFWTRLTVMPLLFLAVWSRTWFGWGALGGVAIALLWNGFNARIFPVPASTDNWVSKSVLGERVWINRSQVPVPAHHHIAPTLLTLISTAGFVLACWGLYTFDLNLTGWGTVLVYAGKIWFLDRMVWLYHDMKEANPTYRSWLY